MTKKQRSLHRRWLKENKGVDLNPEPKRKKPEVHMPVETEPEQVPLQQWERVKFDGEHLKVDEMVLLVRTDENTPLRIFMSGLEDVKVYRDDKGGILIKPDHVPEASLRDPAGTGKPRGRARVAEGSREVLEGRRERPKVLLVGRYALNPAKEGTKRYFLFESMLDGGAAVEIVDRADKWATKSGLYPRGDLKKTILNTTSNVRDQYEQMSEKIAKTGQAITVREEDGLFAVDLPEHITPGTIPDKVIWQFAKRR